MPRTPKTAALIRDLHEEWRRVEVLSATAQRLRPGLIAAVSNELRYAGRHLIEAISADGNLSGPEVQWHLELAMDHCRRARNDAIDANVAFVVESMKAAVRKYGLNNLLELNPSLESFFATLKKTNELISIYRNAPEHQDAIYDQVESLIPPLIETFETIELPSRYRFFSGGLFSNLLEVGAVSALAAALLVGSWPSLHWLDPVFVATVAALLGAIVSIIGTLRGRSNKGANQ